jgi:diacylglycerol kinase (ATP)
MPRKVLFIVNPNAGKKISDEVIELIRKEFPQNIYFQIVIWKDKNHFDEIITLLKSGDYSDAVAIGGDGTVNRVAQAVLGTEIVLGIVPIGSGNGLARSLGISMKLNEAIHQIVNGATTKIDAGLVNGIPFFCTSGVGFDAHIGSQFAASVKRGLQAYVKITFRELFAYRAKEYTIKIGAQEIRKKAFLITVANAGQYGNDFYIAPQASLQDGLFHVVILKPFNFISVFGIFFRILSRKAHLSSYIETYKAKELVIERQEKDWIHFDGEPALEGNALVYKNNASALKVIIGSNFKAV